MHMGDEGRHLLTWLCWWDARHAGGAGLAAGRGREGQGEQGLNPLALTAVSSYVHSVRRLPPGCWG